MRNFGRMPLSSLLLRLGCAFALLISYPGQSAQAVDSPDSRSDVPQSAPASVSAVEYSKKGADTCIKCHDEASKFPVFAIFKTRHAMKGDPRTPFAGLQCEACHGPAGSHVDRVKPGEKRPPILNFGEKSAAPAEAQNRMCLQCHQDANHIGWKGSPHEAGQVSCANCHTIHAAHDPVLDRVTQPDVCFKCHLKERAEFFKPSNHPVRFGQLDCSDSVGACARGRGLQPVPYAARLHQPGVADQTAAVALPAVPFTARASERGVYHAGFAGCESVRLPARRVLHELSLTGAWVEQSVRGQADALARPEQRFAHMR
jgi:predicted CXXCH cytochrome family protein